MSFTWPNLLQTCQLTHELIWRTTELEVENTRLLKEGQSNLEKMDTVYAQLLHERTALVKANDEIKKLETLVDEAHRDQEISHKVANEALDQAEEAKKKEEETSRILAESIATFEEEKDKLAQQGYDACYEELKDDYAKMVDDLYTNGYEEAYRLVWREALKVAAVSENSVLFKKESIVWPSGYVPQPIEEDFEEETESITAQAEGIVTAEIIEEHIVETLTEEVVPQISVEPTTVAVIGQTTEHPTVLNPVDAAAVILGADVHIHGVDVIVSHNNLGHDVPPTA